ncbi:MAG TPA: hypothetical protein VKB51_12235 [bacterium]|nr:hypothetical protein [bacterium]
MSLLDALAVGEEHGFDEVNRAILRAGLGDGLPVVPPTPARVEAMLAGRNPAAVLAVLPPARGEATWRQLALCAVLAGCEPPALPVLAAAVRAVADPAFNLLGVATTTGNAAVGLIVHGPAARAAAVHGGSNALGPGAAGNATLGRALSLVLRNVAGAVPGKTDMATQGQPAKYTFCFAENEAAGPWGALHASRGLSASQGAVTVFAASGLLEIVDAASSDGEGVLATCAQSMLAAGSLGGTGLLGGGQPILLLAPEHAELIARTHTRTEAQAALHAAARLPIERLAPEVRAHLLAGRPAGAALTELTVAERPEAILLAVVGGVGRKSTYVPSWGGGSLAITRPVELA